MVPWGILALRLVLGGILLAHGLLRVVPSLAEKAAVKVAEEWLALSYKCDD